LTAITEGVRVFIMLRYFLMCLAAISLMSAAMISTANAADVVYGSDAGVADSSGYHLGAGDVVNIAVYGEDDLSRKAYKLPDSGLITFPFGEVRALGLSLTELENRVADGLRGGYLVNPRVSVSIDTYRPFFINGQVNSAGAYPYQPGMSVRKAVALAGGLKERASESKIYVMRETDAEHKQTKISMDGPVFAGDTVTVEESFF